MLQHSKYEYGTVNHALCAALRELLREFASKVAVSEFWGYLIGVLMRSYYLGP